jgi:Na+/H+ antiporter NhaD/arsenite permease-like protein
VRPAHASEAGGRRRKTARQPAGSTITGDLLVLDAASNVVIIQTAERRGTTLTFLDFARAGLPVTLLNATVYWCYLALTG